MNVLQWSDLKYVDDDGREHSLVMEAGLWQKVIALARCMGFEETSLAFTGGRCLTLLHALESGISEVLDAPPPPPGARGTRCTVEGTLKDYFGKDGRRAKLEEVVAYLRRAGARGFSAVRRETGVLD